MKIRNTDKKTPKPWELDLGLVLGRRKREFFKSEEDARAAMKEKLNELRMNGENSLAMSTGLRLRYMAVEEKARARNITIDDLWLFYERHSVKLEPRPLLEAVEACIAAKRASGAREIYTATFKRCLNTLANMYPNALTSTLTAEQITAWAYTRKKDKNKPLSLDTVRGRLIDARTFLNFCIRRKWALENPCKAIEPIQLEEKPPGIHTLAQIKLLLATAKKHDPALLGYLCPIYFGGLRPAESQKLKKEEVHKDVIEVQGPKGKGRRRRFVPINPTLKRWLKVKGVGFGMSKRSRRLLSLRRIIKKETEQALPWPHDVLRHSFCSYGVPKYGATKIATWASHNEDVLFNRYRERVKPADAEAYWSLRP